MTQRPSSTSSNIGPPDPVDSKAFEKWLARYPRRWSVAIATRSALRVLPLLHDLRGEFDIVLPVVRSVAIARFAGKYSNRTIKSAASAASKAYDAADDSRVGKTGDFHRISYAADAAAFAADACAAATPADAAAAAIAVIDSVSTAVGNAATALSREIRNDASQLSKRDLTPRNLMSAPLWAKLPPSRISKSWQGLSQELRVRGAHWSIWIDWYEDVLTGVTHNLEAYDAAFTDIPGKLRWDESAEAVNTEIARRLTSLRPDPAPVDGIPSPIAISQLKDGRIGADGGDFSVPTLPESLSPEDHARALAACRSRAEQLRKLTSSPQFQGRTDYTLAFGSYLEWLPVEPNVGNILLADGEARVLNKLFAADEGILAAGFASRLSVFLEDHIALRPFYPEIERHYYAVRTGRLARPLSRDAVEALRGVVHAQTPNVFHESVSPTIDEVAKPVPDAKPPSREDTPPADPGRPKPPIDPIAEVDPQRSRSFIAASALNRIWGILQKGKNTSEGIEGWKKTYDQFRPHIGTIIDWLSGFWPGGGNPPPPPTIGV